MTRICRLFGYKQLAVVIVAAVGPQFLSGCGLASGGYNVQGVQLFQQGQYQPAIQKFQQAIHANPGDVDAYYNLAATYHRMGKVSNDQTALVQAENLYKQCLEYSPNHSDTHRGLAVLLAETGRPGDAFRSLENWVIQQPHVAEAKVELARLYEEFGDAESAKRHLEEALVADTSNARAWAALANLREKSGDYRQALANYQRSYQLNSLQPQVATRISSLQSGLGGSPALSAPPNSRMVRQPSWVPRRY